MRTTPPVAAHVFLLRLWGPGFEDGKHGLPAGDLDGSESATVAADLRAVGVVHYASPAGEGRDLFFAATRWAGEPIPCAGAGARSTRYPQRRSRSCAGRSSATCATGSGSMRMAPTAVSTAAHGDLLAPAHPSPAERESRGTAIKENSMDSTFR